MKISKVNNTEIVIQARSAEDFQKAEQVADKMVDLLEQWGFDVAVGSVCDVELWVHLTVADGDASHGSGMEAWLTDAYKEAKTLAH